MVLARKPKMCSFLEWRDLKIVYKRLANDLHRMEETTDALYLACSMNTVDLGVH